ncbi:hypothetical protein ACIBEH_32820 [Nocardia salmonicida]|uniref:hypothetical protein n=1 Tax=Nocardia salmonicida TaxID=53431 RepID=UPI0037B50BE6
MTIDLGSVLAGSQWAVFWIQLPLLVLVAAVMIAVLRADSKDVPKLLEPITTVLAQRMASRSLFGPRRPNPVDPSATSEEDAR